MLWKPFWQMPWSLASANAIGVPIWACMIIDIMSIVLMVFMVILAVDAVFCAFSGERKWQITPRRCLLELMLLGAIFCYPHTFILVALFGALPLALLRGLLFVIAVCISNDVDNPWTPIKAMEAWRERQKAKADQRSISIVKPAKPASDRALSRTEGN